MEKNTKADESATPPKEGFVSNVCGVIGLLLLILILRGCTLFYRGATGQEQPQPAVHVQQQ